MIISNHTTKVAAVVYYFSLLSFWNGNFNDVVAVALSLEMNNNPRLLHQQYKTTRKYPFVHPSKAKILSCTKNINDDTKKNINGLSQINDKNNEYGWLNPKTVELLENVSCHSIYDLIDFANECDQLLFSSNENTTEKNKKEINHNNHCYDYDYDWSSSSIKKFIEIGLYGNEYEITVATLLALNGLESAIRKTTGYTTVGRAPLLKVMIKQIHDIDSIIAKMLTFLLQPTPGLNLRNIMWHGFLGTIPRQWLAVTLILTKLVMDRTNHRNSSDIQNIEVSSSSPQRKQKQQQKIQPQQTQRRINKNPEVMKLRSYESLRIVISAGDNLILSLSSPSSSSATKEQENHQVKESSFVSIIKRWLPSSHHGLWDLAYRWIAEENMSNPTCTIAVLTVLLEHALRLDWCHVNQRIEDSFARLGAYFVTLDGHGQRDVHDLLLYPYLTAKTNMKSNTTSSKAMSDTAPKRIDHIHCMEKHKVFPDCITKTNKNFNSDHTNATDGKVNDVEQMRRQRKNKLVNVLGGSTIALLTDLFASSCGGPNIRSSISHGVWDNYLDQELATMIITTKDDSDITNSSNNATATIKDDDYVSKYDDLCDMVRVILVAMGLAATASLQQQNDENKGLLVDDNSYKNESDNWIMIDDNNDNSNSSIFIDDSIILLLSGVKNHYQPIFSYQADMNKNIRNAITKLTKLAILHEKPVYQDLLERAEANFGNYKTTDFPLLDYAVSLIKTNIINTSDNLLDATFMSLSPLSSKPSSEGWTLDDVYTEHEINHYIASCTAARVLFKNVADATGIHNDVVESVLSAVVQQAEANDDDEINSNDNSYISRRRRRQDLRVIHSSDLAMKVYSFAFMVALITIGRQLRQKATTIAEDRAVEVNNDHPRNTEEPLSPALLLKAVERSRMVLSTVSRFLHGNDATTHTNTDRAIKAAKDYTKGKAIKAVAQFLSAMVNTTKTTATKTDEKEMETASCLCKNI